ISRISAASSAARDAASDAGGALWFGVCEDLVFVRAVRREDVHRTQPAREQLDGQVGVRSGRDMDANDRERCPEPLGARTLVFDAALEVVVRPKPARPTLGCAAPQDEPRLPRTTWRHTALAAAFAALRTRTEVDVSSLCRRAAMFPEMCAG